MAFIFTNRILGLAFCLGLSLSAIAAEADHKERSVSVVERKRAPVTKGGSSKKKEPTFDQSELYASKIEEKLIVNIQKTISILETTGERLPQKSAQRADVLEKVLNLSLEQAAYLSSQESRRYDQEFETWEKSGSRGAAPKLNSSQSIGHWTKVAGIAERILQEYPKGKSADIVAFNYALALQFLNRDQEAAKAYSQLIQKYPNSPVSGDAYCSLGDYYFDKLDFRNALNNYGSALKFRKSSRYSFALFKSGWSYYNLGQYRQALESWKKTVTYSRINPSKSNLALKEETLRDMVYAFAELGDVEQAISYFNANGGQEFVGQFLKLLANTYSDQGKYAKSIDAYRRLQKAAPFSPESPDAQVEIISLSYELGQMKTVWTELERSPQLFSESSPWAAKNTRKKVLEVQITIRDQILYYAKLSHKKAQQSDNVNQFAQARYGYELFLRSFPKSKEVVEVKYNLADILFFEKKYRDAGKIYLELALLGADKAVIYNEKGAATENVHKKSAEYMLDAFSKDFDPELKQLLKEVPAPGKPTMPISARAQNFLKACGTYMKMYPEDKKIMKNCEVYTAEIYYRTNNKKKALPYLWLVANKYSDEPEGKAAVENIIPLYKDDKKGLLLAAKKLSTNPNYQKGDLGVKLGELLQGAEVESVASEKDALKRGEGWMKQAERYKSRKDAPKYLYNASVDFLKAGEVDKAILAYTAILEKYPKFEQNEEVYLQLAKIYDKRMEHGSAIKYYAAFANQFPKSKEAGGAVQRHCFLRIALAPESALNSCLDVARYSKEASLASVEELLESLYFAKKYDEMVKIYVQSYLTKYKLSSAQNITAHYRIYSALGKKSPEALKYGQMVLSDFKAAGSKAEGSNLRYVGEIVFNNANLGIAKYLGLTLKGGSVPVMQKSIEVKSNALAQLENAYLAVSKVRDSYWGVAALHQIGYAYEQLGKQLANPPAINGASLEDVKKQLAPLSENALKKSFEFYSNAQTTAKKFGVYSDYTALLAVSLQRSKAGNLAFQDWVVLPDFLGGEVPMNIANKLQ